MKTKLLRYILLFIVFNINTKAQTLNLTDILNTTILDSNEDILIGSTTNTSSVINSTVDLRSQITFTTTNVIFQNSTLTAKKIEFAATVINLTFIGEVKLDSVELNFMANNTPINLNISVGAKVCIEHENQVIGTRT